MDRDNFVSLPTPILAGLLWDLVGGKLKDTPNVTIPSQPQYDSRIRRKDGYCFASECDAEGLRFWIKRAGESSNPEFAEKNAKEKTALEYFLKWRECYPSAIWSGVRGKKGDAPVMAKPPSGKPEIYQWEPKGGAPAASSRAAPRPGGYGADDDFGSGDDVPF